MIKWFDLDGVSPFRERAKIYAKARPSYPKAAVRFIFEEAVVPGGGVIVDVGAGTGLGTNLLAGHGKSVIGVDPNLEMLRAASPGPGVFLMAGRAERLPFGNATISLMISFNAFHWFQPEPFFAEARRVLKLPGALALVWNNWELSDPFTARFVSLMRSFAPDLPPEDREVEVEPLYATRLFTNVRRASFENVHTLNLEGLRLRLQSVSYIPRSGPDWDRASSELDSLFQTFADRDGLVRHRYQTSVFVAESSQFSIP